MILVSHGHGDHVGDTIDIAKRTGAVVVSNYEIGQWLQGKGLKDVHGMQHSGGHSFSFGRVKLTLAFHGSVLPDGTYGGNPCGFLLTFQDGKKVYTKNGPNTYNDARMPFFKMGIYKGWKDFSPVSVKTRTLYHDQLRFVGPGGGYSLVAPTSSSKVSAPFNVTAK